MITLPELAAGALGSFLASDMKDRFGSSHARLAELIPFAARLALECIGNSDALYHNVEHTMLVTLAGHDIFKGRALMKPSTPTDYSNFIVACLAHDIGYVRGVVKGDGDDGYIVDGTGRKVSLPRGSSDAALGPYHVERSKLFVLRHSRNSTAHGLHVRSDSRDSHIHRRPTRRRKLTKKGHSYELPISSVSLAIPTI
jgi:hypothetical protein